MCKPMGPGVLGAVVRLPPLGSCGSGRTGPPLPAPPQAVLQDYQLQLRTIFDHYTSGKSLMSLAEFTSMLVDSGLVPTAVEKARQQIEGKLKEAVCCDIFIHLQ
eukprot:Sspe_Gene.114098::Locus_99325_Transcript_2_3_Confidence_0.400_Length_311::g.114098::m.114098